MSKKQSVTRKLVEVVEASTRAPLSENASHSLAEMPETPLLSLAAGKPATAIMGSLRPPGLGGAKGGTTADAEKPS